MSNSNLSALSIAELKAIAAELDAVPTNDKRSKQSWIDIITLTREVNALAQAEPQTEEEFDAISSEYDGLSEVLCEMLLNDDTTEPDSSDDDTWNLDDAIADDAQSEIIANAVDEATAKRAPSPKKGAVSVAASIVCLLIFLLTAFCQTLAFVIKYTCLLVMLFGRWNPNLDIWYQLTQRAAERKRLDIASA